MTFERFKAAVEHARVLLQTGTAPDPVIRMTARASRPCKDCGLMIHFVPAKDDSVQPFDGDGKSHYLTCSAAEEHRARIGPMGAAGYVPQQYLHRPVVQDAAKVTTPPSPTPTPPREEQASLFGGTGGEEYPD